jgi:uncharacterized protein (TIGR03435 family)
MIVDKTNLTHLYDIQLQLASDTSSIPRASDPSRLLAIVQEQLGLSLEVTRAPVDVIVIDSVQRPSAN